MLALALGAGAGRVPPHGGQFGIFPLPRGLLIGLAGGVPPEALPGDQDEAVDGQEYRRELRLAEHGLEGLLQRQARDADRYRAQHDHPGEPLVGGVHLAVADGRDQAADDPDPVPPEVHEQPGGGGHVQPDDESQVGR